MAEFISMDKVLHDDAKLASELQFLSAASLFVERNPLMEIVEGGKIDFFEVIVSAPAPAPVQLKTEDGKEEWKLVDTWEVVNAEDDTLEKEVDRLLHDAENVEEEEKK